MNPTSVSLLDRLRAARPDDPDWLRLEEIYQPLIRRWLGRVPGLGDETDDFTQEVFLVIVRRDTPVRAPAGRLIPGVGPAGHRERLA